MKLFGGYISRSLYKNHISHYTKVYNATRYINIDGIGLSWVGYNWIELNVVELSWVGLGWLVGTERIGSPHQQNRVFIGSAWRISISMESDIIGDPNS